MSSRCMCVNSPQWRSLSGPGWVYWLWMECGACYGQEPWYTPVTRKTEKYGLLCILTVHKQVQKWAEDAANLPEKNMAVWSQATAKRCKQTFRTRRLLLILAPSRRVWRSALDVSAPLSFPARSMRENLPCIFPFRLMMIWNTAWLRDEWALADVWPDVLGVRQRRLEGEQITSVKTARNEQL